MDFSRYQALPDDWQLIVADITNSTGAIQSGLYKAVNILGVSVITSIVNLAKPLSIPYIFGGDGAVVCVPASLVPRARQALITTILLARRAYNLDLRAGLVPAGVVSKAGVKTLVAKHRMSQYYVQTAFAGGGVDYAERLIKDEKAGAAYRLDEDDAAASAADFSGLECRWDNVPSKHGEIIALIVKAVAPSIEKEAIIYNEIIAKVRQIYGDDDMCRPVHAGGLRTTFDGGKLSHETRIRTFGQGTPAYIRYLSKIRAQNVLGWLLMTFGINAGGTPWGDYKKDLVLNTDFKKFDGVFRAILSGTAEQRGQLTDYLENRYRKNECVYGVHASDSALITCLISKRAGEHYHFVDGAGGGYAMAATAMKDRLKRSSSMGSE